MNPFVDRHIRHIWQKKVQERQRTLDPAYILYHTLRADNPAMAEKLRDWQTRQDDAHKTFAAYIDKLQKTSQQGPLSAKIYYQVNEDGRLNRIGCYGALPRGWALVQDTEDHWIEPETPEARRDLQSVPAAPALRERADIIRWSYRNENIGSPESRQAARQFNRLPRVREENNAVLVDLPDSRNFTAHPMLHHVVDNWQQPAGLTYVGVHNSLWSAIVHYGTAPKAAP